MEKLLSFIDVDKTGALRRVTTRQSRSALLYLINKKQRLDTLAHMKTLL